MAIDIDDLGKILTLIRYRWTPVYSEEINGLINGRSVWTSIVALRK